MADYNSGGRYGKPAQLYALSSLHGLVKRTNELLADDSIQIAFDSYLAEFSFDRVDNVRARWAPVDKRATVLNLVVERTLPDDTQEVIPLDAIDANEPIIAVSARSYLEVTEDIHSFAKVAAEHQCRSRKALGGKLYDGRELLPEGVSGAAIDFSLLSPRVIGFETPTRADRKQDIQTSGAAWFREDDAIGDFVSFRIAQPDGTARELSFATPDDARSAVANLDQALEDKREEPIALGGSHVVPSAPLRDALVDALRVYQDPTAAQQDTDAPASLAAALEPIAPARQVAIIAEVESSRLLPDPASVRDNVPWALLSSMLHPTVQLKEHQKEGIRWLWSHYQRKRPGALLADDMGLGKTLQVLCFLALQIAAGAPEDRGRPILIVCPLILVANWRNEIDKYFRKSCFNGIAILQGDGLKEFRSAKGIDSAKLLTRAIALCTYDSLDRYQKSLLVIDWATVVLDEAQNIKNPDAYRTRAARGLKRSFGIAATGTPVENRLLDLWAICDFLSPGQPFADRTSFTRDYETPAKGPALARAALLYPSPSSPVLRRTKAESLALPAKNLIMHKLAMTESQRQTERAIAQSASTVGILGTLQKLQKLYQHPWLLRPERDGVIPAAEIIAASPKLAKCIEVLEQVRERGEKALVFTLWTAMQDMLVYTLRNHFKLRDVDVVNGDSNAQGQSSRIIDRFKSEPGFALLVLSPLAAGAGINVTEANHVIHYGRWWNPAKEDQATDRAYRIGQEREVQVHHLVLHHPNNPEAGFDVSLHNLVERKRAIATDFLAPMAKTGPSDKEIKSMFEQGVL